jgi:diguanylate cyclase (GGDEF)-like protein/PAS domain S-box-containing protein
MLQIRGTQLHITLAEILDNLFDEAVYFVDADRRISFWNRSAERLTGFTSSEVVGSRCKDDILNHVDDKGIRLCENGCPVSMVLEDGVPRETRVFLHHKDGHRIPIRARILPMQDDTGAIVGAIEIFTDRRSGRAMSERVQELERLALIDPMTQLSNRRHLESELGGLFKQQKRLGITFGLLFIDIDHFKDVNDTFGHDTGDLVLKMVARTLTSAVREFDNVGRWGGEEFVILARANTEGELFGLAERLRHLVSQSFLSHMERRIQVTVSIGATMARDGDTVSSLLRRADDLLYRSKQEGRNRTTCT